MTDVEPASPAWVPDPGRATRMGAFHDFAAGRANRQFADFAGLHEWSVTDSSGFWAAVWDFFDVVGDPGSVVHVPTQLPRATFFPEARLNIAETYLRPVAGRDDVGLPLVVQTAEVGDGVAVVRSVDRDELVEIGRAHV